jgi:very-short-patch-repair endonuclease
MLAIEIDGDSHIGKEEADKVRQEKLESLGVRVLRFGDREVKSNIDGVLRTIEDWIVSNT